MLLMTLIGIMDSNNIKEKKMAFVVSMFSVYPFSTEVLADTITFLDQFQMIFGK